MDSNQKIIVLLHVLFLIHSTTALSVKYLPGNITMHMHHNQTVQVIVSGPQELILTVKDIKIKSDNAKLLRADDKITGSEVSENMINWNGTIILDALFLGNPSVYVEVTFANGSRQIADQQLPIVIIREERVIDHIFVGSVAILVSILYINFGAALNVPKLRGHIVKPIGPAIGLSCQFIIMPLLSFALGMILFPDNAEMQLGMFFTGVSPAGGASNIWTILLGGNMDLSIAMTSIGNIAAFGTMPFWLFTLGKVIFDRGDIPVPYRNLLMYLIALIVPLSLGLIIQRYFPRLTKILVRILKPMASFLILFIVIFAIFANLYLFEIFSWQIIVAGMCLPWLAYIIAFCAAWICKQPAPDRLAIALETGIQNTGIAIFLLRFTLPQPQADLTTVVPVAVAIMTPLPLLTILMYQKMLQCMVSADSGEKSTDQSTTDRFNLENRRDGSTNLLNT